MGQNSDGPAETLSRPLLPVSNFRPSFHPLKPDGSKNRSTNASIIGIVHARELARRASRVTGKPIARVVEEALEDYVARLGAARSSGAMDRALALAAADRARLPPNTTSDTADFYDAEGMPL